MTTNVQDVQSNVDLLSAILWQYDGDGSNILKMVQSKQQWYQSEQADFWNNWFSDVFDIRTANEFGLSVWSVILGVPLSVDRLPDVKLTVEQKRLVIRLRFYQLVTRATIPDVNGELADVFSKFGEMYALDPNDMSSIMYVLLFEPDDDLRLILKEYDLLPRPATVGLKYRVLNGEYFGFGEFNENFNNGAYYPGDEL